MEPQGVVAGVLLRDRRVLLCHRSPGRVWFPDVWDLPGGHIEGDETEEAALTRELAEEIGVQVEVPIPPPLARIRTEGLDLAIYLVERWEGAVRNMDIREQDRFAWFAKNELSDLQLAHSAYLGLLTQLLT